MPSNKIDSKTLKKVASLAKLKVSEKKLYTLSKQLSKVLDYASEVQSVDTTKTSETKHTLPIKNIFRNDQIDSDGVFTQEQALSQAKKKHNGYFLTDSVFE